MKEAFVDMKKIHLYHRGETLMTIYKNPSAKEMSHIGELQLWGIRGIILRNGDFLTVAGEEEGELGHSSMEVIHDDLGKIILQNKAQYNGWEFGDFNSTFIMVITARAEDMFVYMIAESYHQDARQDLEQYFEEYKRNFKKKQQLPFELVDKGMYL